MRNSVNKDEYFMVRALALAKNGFGAVEPNPYVGCVIVKNGEIISSGYHKLYGGAHAESNAIGRLTSEKKKNLINSTLYVNLEPCCHQNKKTPPCVPMIIAAGIKKVVIAIKDPNPRVNGKGIKDLTAAGIECKTGLLHLDATELNKIYLKNIKYQMPFVTLKAAMTLDGKIADCNGTSKWITSSPARLYTHKLRTEHDAILVGVNTVIKDNPRLTSHNTGRNPTRVIIDPENRLHRTEVRGQRSEVRKTKFNVLNAAAKTIIFTGKAIKSKNDNLEFIKLTKMSDKYFSFKAIMKELYNRGICSVLIEGGGETNYFALKEGVVDEILFFIAPKIIGGRSAPTPVEGEGLSLREGIGVKITQMGRVGADILIKGKFGRKHNVEIKQYLDKSLSENVYRNY